MRRVIGMPVRRSNAERWQCVHVRGCVICPVDIRDEPAPSHKRPSLRLRKSRESIGLRWTRTVRLTAIGGMSHARRCDECGGAGIGPYICDGPGDVYKDDCDACSGVGY